MNDPQKVEAMGTLLMHVDLTDLGDLTTVSLCVCVCVCVFVCVCVWMHSINISLVNITGQGCQGR